MIDKALLSLYPNAQWSLHGDSYECLEWLDKVQAKPTEAEINAEIVRLQAKYEAMAYKEKRAKEYPPIAEQLDALWKGGDAAAEMLAKVQAVKNKYPKGAA